MNAILAQQAHRPWPLPKGPWVMTQEWCDLLFAHWSIPADLMRTLVPSQFELDLWDDKAWVGVVPFRMQGVRPRGLPAIPWLSAFPELNVRTYVTLRDRGIAKPGVCFFSLEAANPVAVAIARSGFKLPYFNADMQLHDDGTTIHYQSERTHRGAPGATFTATYAPTGPIERAAPASFDAWLTERYALYTVDRAQQPYIGEIHHEPWPLQPATADFQINTVAEASGIQLPAEPPLLHFARYLRVYVWPLRKVE